MRTHRLVVAAALGLLLAGLGAPAAGAAGPLGLSLGVARVRGDGTVAVPVRLRVPAGAAVAALNFTLRWDVGQAEAAAPAVVAGAGVVRARAELASRTDAAAGTLRVLVVPAFRAEVGALRGQRVATVYLRPRGAPPAAAGRWVRRHVRLTDVVLGTPDGRELRLRAGGGRS